VTLKVYNTLTKKEEEFKPIEDRKVKMYVCGVTVYDDIHMGHARSMIVFDMISRYLRHQGYQVTHVTNFTDVDDKIINRANELGMDPLELSRNYIEEYFRDAKAVGVKKADLYPKASENIPQIIGMIKRIMDNGMAYQSQGSVYFAVDKVEDYGKLSGQRREDMVAGARIEVDESKRNPMDFALWKAAKPGEIFWDSPWGPGRPGWHIECSAMVTEYLGDTIDIHGGGNDLIFPHHENEILQSEAATGRPLANYWLHNGMLQVQETKMSKSLKNFFTVKDVLKDFTKEEVRFFVLNTHYRGPLSYSEDALKEAAASLKRLHNTYRALQAAQEEAKGGNDLLELSKRSREEFVRFMDEDFNTRGAISVLFDLSREANRVMADGTISKAGARNLISVMEEVDSILGVLSAGEEKPETAAGIIQILLDVRKELRSRKAYDLADLIRKRLDEEGVEVQDTAEGAKWKWK